MTTLVLEDLHSSEKKAMRGKVQVLPPERDKAFKPSPKKKTIKHKKDASLGGEDKVTGKKYRVPVPEHLKFYRLPENLNLFIEEIYPNMLYLAKTKSPKAGDPSCYALETINEFMVYMLGFSAKKKKYRWQIYDSVKYMKLPYYRWWLENLKYFCLRRKNDFSEKRKREISIVFDADEANENEETIHISRIFNAGEHCCKEDEVFLEGLTRLVAKRAKKFSKYPDSVEAGAPCILDLHIKGWSESQISRHFKISYRKVCYTVMYLENMVELYCGQIKEEDLSIFPE